MPALARAGEAVRLRRWGEAGNAALCAGLCFLFGALVLQPWRGSLGVPYLYRGDSTLYQASVKGVLDHGWYWHNASLGAPGQAQLFDFPSLGGDPLNVLVFKFLGLFTDDSAVVMNVFFLLTFPAVGLAAYLVHGFFDYFLEFTPTYGLLWLLAGIVTALSRTDPRGVPE